MIRLPASRALGCLVFVTAVQPLPARAPAGKDGFISLFKGKDLTGCKAPAGLVP